MLLQAGEIEDTNSTNRSIFFVRYLVLQHYRKYLPERRNTHRFQVFARPEYLAPCCHFRLPVFDSNDNAEWKLVSEGEFSNIKNNPLWQTKSSSPEKTRYIKLRAVRNTDGDDETGYEEADVITK